MGKKSTSTSKPAKEFMPYMLDGANTLQSNYQQNAGTVQSAADSVTGLLPGMIAKYNAGNPALNAASGYNVDVLGGKYLDSNPYLDQMIGNSNDDIRNQMQAALGAKGLTGGSSYADLISSNIAKNTLATRYNAYNDERGRMATAAGQAPGIAAGEAAQINPLMSVLGASTLPGQNAANYAGSLGGLLGGYQSQTQKPSTASSVMDGVGTALQLASLFSDARLKTDITPIGRTDGGLPVYTYRYGGAGPFHMGVMAQEVREAQPEALGPEISGYMTVNYGEVH